MLNWEDTVMDDEAMLAIIYALPVTVFDSSKLNRSADSCKRELCEAQAKISFKLGQEEERKKWIKEAMGIGILIAKPKEQAGIAREYRLQGINEVVEWIEERRLKGEGSFSKTVLFQGDAEIRNKDLQAFKKEKGIK